MSGILTPMPGREQNEAIAKRMTEAREQGALYHITNPADNYFCSDCCVFGKGGSRCWSCGTPEVKWQWVPRWGGGAQSVIIEEGE